MDEMKDFKEISEQIGKAEDIGKGSTNDMVRAAVIVFRGLKKAMQIAIDNYEKRHSEQEKPLKFEFRKLVLSDIDDNIAFQKISEGSYRVIEVPDNLKDQCGFGDEID